MRTMMVMMVMVMMKEDARHLVPVETKTLVGEEDDDIDGGEGDGEDDKKDNAGHLVPVEHHKGLSRKMVMSVMTKYLRILMTTMVMMMRIEEKEKDEKDTDGSKDKS